MINTAADPNEHFGYLACLAKTWGILRDYWFVLMLGAFLRDLVSILPAVLVFALFLDFRGWNIAIALVVGCVIWSGLQAGYIKFCLHICRHRQVNWQTLFSCLPFCFQMFCATTCLWVSVALGLVFLIVPGLIIAAKFSLYGLALTDQKLGPLKSLLSSYRMLKGFTWCAIGLLLIYFIGCAAFSWLSLAFHTFLIISLCILYEHIRMQESTR